MHCDCMRANGCSVAETSARALQGRLVVLDAPNLNRLGKRQPEIFGHETLADVAVPCRHSARGQGISLDFTQSTAGRELTGWGCATGKSVAGVASNPAGYSHRSIVNMNAGHHGVVSRVPGGICGCGITGHAPARQPLVTLPTKAAP